MMFFILRILITVICLGLVVVIHEAGHFWVARRLGVRVERFTVGFGPEIVGWTHGQTRYAICIVPLGGMVKLAGEMIEEHTQAPDEFFSQPWYGRIAIASAGPVMNYALAFILFAVVAWGWGVVQPSTQPVIGDMVENLPAAQAHMEIGDRILSIDQKPIASWEEMATVVHAKPAQQILLHVERTDEKTGHSRQLDVSLTPQKDPQKGIGLIGIMPKVDMQRVGFVGSIQASYKDVKTWTVQPLQYLSQKLRHWEAPKDLSGPLGIAQMVTKATKEGPSYVIYLIAIISTGLGFLNLWPIPVLDGGHVFLYLTEGIIRRPLSAKALQIANAIGLSLVLTLFLYASYQDILRLHLGFWK